MVAVSETGLAVPIDASYPWTGEDAVEGRRVVAVAVSPMELLRPGSDLLQMIDGADRVDLLLACEAELVDAPRPVCVLPVVTGGAVAREAWDVLGDDLDDDLGDDLDDDLGDDLDDDEDDDRGDDLRAAVDALGVDDLHLHRLALPAPLGAGAEPDLVAALSELVGFDPEPGVRVLAPALLAGDPERSVLDRAVRRVAQVYGLSLQRYRCLELSVVDC